MNKILLENGTLLQKNRPILVKGKPIGIRWTKNSVIDSDYYNNIRNNLNMWVQETHKKGELIVSSIVGFSPNILIDTYRGIFPEGKKIYCIFKLAGEELKLICTKPKLPVEMIKTDLCPLLSYFDKGIIYPINLY